MEIRVHTEVCDNQVVFVDIDEAALGVGFHRNEFFERLRAEELSVLRVFDDTWHPEVSVDQNDIIGTVERKTWKETLKC